MTEEALRMALAESIAQTLDTMFFTACRQATAAAGESGERLAARVAFAGKPSGRLTVRIEPGAARAIAAGFLGEEEGEVTARQTGDVLCELANMICGFVLSRVESEDEFRLGEPRLEEPGADACAERAAGPGAAVYAVETGFGVLTAELEMEGCSA